MPKIYSQSRPQPVSGKMDWWQKARFGMFIHWGVYAVPAGVYHGKQVDGLGEWIMNDEHIPRAEYKKYAAAFNPVDYNPEKWVRAARQAGMKYIVITAKHHDGFALFDTKASDWNVVKATPYGKDLLKPLAEACRKEGMKLGFYYSQANDWYNPGGAAAFGHWDSTQAGSMDDYIDNIVIPQVRELLTEYGDVAELWWDVPTGMTAERAAKINKLLSLQPGVITNDRLGGGFEGDFTTPEQYIPGTGMGTRNWETCMTVNDTWGYKKNDHNWKSAATLIRYLVDIASKGGNYLLNVGPDADGNFPEPIVQRLQRIGAWMAVNGESIYGTTASPFQKLGWGRCTEKKTRDGSILYLHVFHWPKDGVLWVPGLKGNIEKVTLLANGKSLRYEKEKEGINLFLPAHPADDIVSVIKLEIKGPLVVTAVPVQPARNGQIELSASVCDIHDEAGNASVSVEGEDTENVGYWTDPQDWISWKVKVPKAGKYRVKAMLASTRATSTLFIGMGMQGVAATVHSTGDYHRYKEVELGTLPVEQAGVYTISVQPDRSNWNPVNLRSIRLVPVP